MTSPLLEVDGLSVRFPGQPADAFAVREAAFRVDPGQTVGIVGESGSGKSTACLAVIGLLPRGTHVEGSIRFDGVELVGMPERDLRDLRGRRIGLVYQDPMAALNPVRTIGAQLREPLRLHLGMSRRAANARAIELLELVGIPDPAPKLSSYPHLFSGGMRQRVVIAMAIACDPALIIADEPTTALDVSVQAQVLDLLEKLTADLGISMLIVSHDLGVIAGAASDVAVMRFGRVVEYGPTERVLAEPEHPYTRELIARVRELEAPAVPDAPVTAPRGKATR